MNHSVKRFLPLGACIAALTILSACDNSNARTAPVPTAARPTTSENPSGTPSKEATMPPAKPAPVASPYATMRNTKGDLVCKGGPVVLIEALDKKPAMEIQLRNGATINVVPTPEGLKITGDPLALDWTASSMIVNNSVGTNVPEAYGASELPSDTILLTKEGYGNARTFALCDDRKIEP